MGTKMFAGRVLEEKKVVSNKTEVRGGTFDQEVASGSGPNWEGALS